MKTKNFYYLLLIVFAGTALIYFRFYSKPTLPKLEKSSICQIKMFLKTFKFSEHKLIVLFASFGIFVMTLYEFTTYTKIRPFFNNFRETKCAGNMRSFIEAYPGIYKSQKALNHTNISTTQLYLNTPTTKKALVTIYKSAHNYKDYSELEGRNFDNISEIEFMKRIEEMLKMEEKSSNLAAENNDPEDENSGTDDLSDYFYKLS
jgi:hypothetical protein